MFKLSCPPLIVVILITILACYLRRPAYVEELFLSADGMVKETYYQAAQVAVSMVEGGRRKFSFLTGCSFDKGFQMVQQGEPSSFGVSSLTTSKTIFNPPPCAD